jgi:hypothetical protein
MLGRDIEVEILDLFSPYEKLNASGLKSQNLKILSLLTIK